MIKVLFLTQTPESGASARYRVYQYLDYLKNNGIECTVSPAVSERSLKRYLSLRGVFTKAGFYLTQLFKRLSDIMGAGKFDVVFLQRDLLIHCYPFLEKLLVSFNRKIVFDFDDAIYHYPTHKKTGFAFNVLWDKKKIERIIKLSRHIIVGNNHLKSYAENFSKNISVIPTSVDLNAYSLVKPQKKAGEPVIIGWMGSQGTFPYLESIFPVFKELTNKYRVKIKVVGASSASSCGLDIDYKPWNMEEEIGDIYSFDIGVMPIADDEWSKGKCGTKLLQYMAAGVPAIGSNVGANSEIIQDGISGFLADSQEEWIKKLSILIEDDKLRATLVNNAKIRVADTYSVQANAPKLLEAIRRVAL